MKFDGWPGMRVGPSSVPQLWLINLGSIPHYAHDLTFPFNVELLSGTAASFSRRCRFADASETWGTNS